MKTETKEWKKEYDYAGGFTEGRAWVRKDGREGYVNLKGEVTWDEESK